MQFFSHSRYIMQVCNQPLIWTCTKGFYVRFFLNEALALWCQGSYFESDIIQPESVSVREQMKRPIQNTLIPVLWFQTPHFSGDYLFQLRIHKLDFYAFSSRLYDSFSSVIRTSKMSNMPSMNVNFNIYPVSTWTAKNLAWFEMPW
jgi:hypothetical protein